jgi:Uma2 family endonuclease
MAAQQDPLAAPEVVPLTIEQYHRMLEAGILEDGDPIELLDGFLVRKDRSGRGGSPVTVHPMHRVVVTRLGDLGSELERHGAHLQTQQPISLPPSQEPEPDGAIVRGRTEDYADRHPGPGDVLCVIEVADSSLRRDRTTKQRIYAAAGIPQYVIVNLQDQVIEVYEAPRPAEGRYGRTTTVERGATFDLHLGPDIRLSRAADAWLPLRTG